ncbi:MAG: hypothetical protein IIA75_10220, partial [Proteobacteria bacterium]|nr:hypothetical protein [Pseudomonadota bacterium]
EALNAACTLALQLLKKPEALGRIRVEAEKTLSEHSLQRECMQFLDIMNNIDQLW